MAGRADPGTQEHRPALASHRSMFMDSVLAGWTQGNLSRRLRNFGEASRCRIRTCSSRVDGVLRQGA